MSIGTFNARFQGKIPATLEQKQLSKMVKKELVELAKKLDLDASGTVAELRERIELRLAVA